MLPIFIFLLVLGFSLFWSIFASFDRLGFILLQFGNFALIIWSHFWLFRSNEDFRVKFQIN